MGILRNLLNKFRKEKKYSYQSMQLDNTSTQTHTYVSWDSTTNVASVSNTPVSEQDFIKKDERIEKKPVELVNEIISIVHEI